MKALALIISLAVALMALPALAAEGGVPVQEGMFPVTNYGAVGDGVFDCTEAFQDAVNAASVQRGYCLGAWRALVNQRFYYGEARRCHLRGEPGAYGD